LARRRQLLAALLVDDAALAAWKGTPAEECQLWTLAVDERVECLLASRLLRTGRQRWHEVTRRMAREALVRATVLEEHRRVELIRISEAFAQSGIRVLLLKGAAWAYTLYPAPALRPRLDTDLLIDARDRKPTEHLLHSLGYRTAVESVMALASAQRHYDRIDDHGVEHFVDLHWRVTNPLVFAEALPFAQLWDRGVGIASLGDARTLCPPDALLLACLHRLAHHGDDSALLWLMDVHLLACALGPDDWNEVRREAAAGRLRGVCAHGLARAGDRLGTPLPAAVSRWLAESASHPVDDVFLGRGVSPLGVLVSDWRAVGTWAGRFRLLRDHVCPARSYVSARYGLPHASWVLPFLYVHRAVSGLARWSIGHADYLLSRTSSTARRHIRAPHPDS
jgi:hypothetical protein